QPVRVGGGHLGRGDRVGRRVGGRGRAAAGALTLPRRPMDRTGREPLLRVYPVLRDLPPGLRGRVEDAGEPVRMPAGQRLFGEGAPCTHYPFLLEGTLRASKFSPEGAQILLYRLNPGEICVLTVAALLGDADYPATA